MNGQDVGLRLQLTTAAADISIVRVPLTSLDPQVALENLAAGIGHPEQFTRIVSGFPLKPLLHASNDPALRARLGLTQADFVVGKIARLTALDHFRSEDRRRGREARYVASEPRDVTDAPMPSESSPALREALGRLSRAERELIALRVVLLVLFAGFHHRGIRRAFRQLPVTGANHHVNVQRTRNTDVNESR